MRKMSKRFILKFNPCLSVGIAIYIYKHVSWSGFCLLKITRVFVHALTSSNSDNRTVEAVALHRQVQCQLFSLSLKNWGLAREQVIQECCPLPRARTKLTLACRQTTISDPYSKQISSHFSPSRHNPLTPTQSEPVVCIVWGAGDRYYRTCF